ncbi:172R [Cherax quadricarinatus iridovirus]|uniref:Uncharacterized protein n=1 Tax=Shrimp hemocyte iridescent virus TaxID=2039780 RepID=A0A291B104_9VIRU|nr:172R [Cherax quadricarinatus iridovirus]YP_010084907.1 hypothetical protein KM509_gp155 [Shrimp hemocyte iridescent virus]UPA43316.1 hypothetical protein 4TH000042 [Iridovirus CN01]ASZ85152.1 172R [Cherax quadricarinatus iridovirus]ATE87164.1 hypothetical protein [Shrimp hemocyte iridescent virus]UPA43551.1 hypothetical protein 3TG000118 [Iridovirus CN01]UPA43748.1 hypothetical protein 1DG000156 [Iridovirus CN01]
MENFRRVNINYCKPCREVETLEEEEVICEDAIFLDGTNKPTEDIDWAGNKITNLKQPENPGDAVTKAYADKIKLNYLSYGTFIKTGESVTIDTTSFPDWQYILGTIKLKNNFKPLIIFREDVGKIFASKIRGDGTFEPGNMNDTEAINESKKFQYVGQVVLEEVTSTTAKIKAQNFGHYDVFANPVLLSSGDGLTDEYGIQKLQFR